ncbi:TPA: hypothetical protein H1V70_004877 [Salmonella enterica]|nr:hypothetical protein [Salmonella enterica]
MSVLISGALINGAGIPMSGCHIILKSRVNTAEAVMRTVADVVTGAGGEYSFAAQTGRYCVYLKQDWRDEYCVGDIAVYDDSKPGTLNDFLTALDEGDLKPDVVKRFEEMVAQAQQSAEAAAESERQAGKHAGAAGLAKEEVKNLATGVQQNADAVAEDKRQVEILASQIEDTASEVRQDAEAAKKAASDAEQARADIDTALSATLKTANHLSEIAAEGAKAQQKSRDSLGLKSAATTDIQTDIYDRTEGRAALPGAFGLGRMFLPKEQVTFNSHDDFFTWIKDAEPGEYLSGGSYTLTAGVRCRGVINVRFLTADRDPAIPQLAVKSIIFYGIYGDIYHNLYSYGGNGSLTGWTDLKVTPSDLITLFCGMDNRNADLYYGVGSILLAAYNIASDSWNIQRGSIRSGSALRPVEIVGNYTPAGPCYSGSVTAYMPISKTLPGSWWALSGDALPLTASFGFSICLFIRGS